MEKTNAEKLAEILVEEVLRGVTIHSVIYKGFAKVAPFSYFPSIALKIIQWAMHSQTLKIRTIQDVTERLSKNYKEDELFKMIDFILRDKEKVENIAVDICSDPRNYV